jgi:hypothetical protein
MKTWLTAMWNWTDRMPPGMTNADGSHFDMRPLTRQALVLFGLVPISVLAYSVAVTPATLGFGVGLRCGALAGFVIASLGWLRSWAFEAKHQAQPDSFWQMHHQRSLRIAWRASLITAAALALVLPIALLTSVVFLAGISLAGLVFPLFVIAGYVDKVRNNNRSSLRRHHKRG